jgi:hypothetical protein
MRNKNLQIGLVLATTALSFISLPGIAQITGSGTASYIPKFTAATVIGNSQIYDNGTNVGVGFTTPSYKLDVNGDMNILSTGAYRIGGSNVFRIPGTANSCFGVSTGTSVTGTCNTLVGNSAGSATSTGGSNTMMGYVAGSAHTTGNDAVYVGRSAGGANTTGSNNTYLGAYAGRAGVSSNNNVIVGAQSGYSLTASECTYIGFQAGYSNTAGLKNTFIGFQSGYTSNNSLGVAMGNTFVGYKTGTLVSTGAGLTFLGSEAGVASTTANNCVFIGDWAGYSNTTGSSNVFIGSLTGQNNTTGSFNTFIGNLAYGASAGTNQTAIGSGAQVISNDAMVFGNSSVVEWGFGLDPTGGNIIQFINTTAKLTGGGVWTNASDQNIKENITQLDGAEVLEKINTLEITRWKYKNTENEYHIGPMAQDFYKLFQTGTDDKTISTIDPAGIALIGVKQLSKNANEQAVAVESLVAENQALQKKVDEMTARLAALENCVTSICNLEKAPVIVPSSAKATLGQNSPNPFNQQTTISYFLPEGAKQGFVKITAMDGTVLKTIAITATGKGELIVGTASFVPGVYNYQLIVDGVPADTKQMVITK